jgi:hypothetical protein
MRCEDTAVTVDLWHPATSEDVEWFSVLAESRLALGDLASRMPTFTWGELLHPAYRIAEDSEAQEVSWAELAGARGSVVPAAAHFDTLVGLPQTAFENGFDDPAGVWNAPPVQGSLPPRQHAALLEVLTTRTGATEAVCGVWAGWAAAHRLVATSAPRRDVAGREVVFFRSPLEGLGASVDEVEHQAPNVMFPLDRRWLVLTDPDHWSTCVGSDPETAAALRAAGSFEMRGAG